MRDLYTIAREIRHNWPKMDFGAKPYVEAMATLGSIDNKYLSDEGKSIVAYFLANANTWQGDVARRIKKELKVML